MDKFGFIDGHADTVTAAMESGQTLYENDLHVDFSRLKAFGAPVQVFSVFVYDKYMDDAFGYAEAAINYYERELAANEQIIRPALSLNDIKKNVSENKISAVLALEGGEPLGGDLTQLNYFYNRGVRLLTLTWNRENALGYGALTGSENGLKPFGVECVRQMDALGMVIDVSHLNEAGFRDVCELAERPFMASHSNAYAVTSHKRNLTDGQIRAVAERGGFIGMNLCPAFLNETEAADIDDIHRHIERFLELGAGDCIGLGCDFDGVSSLPENISGVSSLKYLSEKFIERFGADAAAKIMSANFYAFFERFFNVPCAP